MSFRPLIAAFAAVSLWSCSSADKRPAPASTAEIAPILATPDAVDIHSFARPLDARVTHVALDLAVERRNRLDFEALVVEDDLLDPGLGLDIERRGAADPFGRKIDAKVERDMRNARVERLGKTMNVDRVGGGEHRRDLRRAGGCGRLVGR